MDPSYRYFQEGMDAGAILTELWRYDFLYDVIVYDGATDQETLRALGAAEVIAWYARRFRRVVEDSDLYKAVVPFIQAATTAILQPGSRFAGSNVLDSAEQVISEFTSGVLDSSKLSAFIVSSDRIDDVAYARWLWGSAQQVGLTVGAVFLFKSDSAASSLLSHEECLNAFRDIQVKTIPPRVASGSDEDGLAALPDLLECIANAPKPITIDLKEKQVRAFLPGFNKSQVRLTRSGPEMTIDCGDQRRNIFLPPALKGATVEGAQFKEPYLIITFV
mmetsp:Transcript_10403/g.16989  ORF Transcript_10403/g.16989 Transcript_10403/m.16989 type:complete len:276 (-) Transcript_10403:517-1344(-)